MAKRERVKYVGLNVSHVTHRGEGGVRQLPGQVGRHLEGDVSDDVSDGRSAGAETPSASASASTSPGPVPGSARAAQTDLLLNLALVHLLAGEVKQRHVDYLHYKSRRKKETHLAASLWWKRERKKINFYLVLEPEYESVDDGAAHEHDQADPEQVWRHHATDNAFVRARAGQGAVHGKEGTDHLGYGEDATAALREKD